MSANQRTDCFFNLTTPERIDLFRRRQALRVENVFRTFYGWAMLPLAIFGAIATMIFIISCYKAIKARRVSRKCYALLMNRAIGDALTCFSALVTCIYVLTWHDINRDMVVVIESFFIGSFWSAMVSYCSLSVLKLFAVWKPFHYRKWFTMRRCVNLMIISWTILVLMVSYTLAVSALVKIPNLNAWSGCKAETCLRNMYRSRNLMTASVYCFTIMVFVGTCFFIRKAQNFSNSFKNGKRTEEAASGWLDFLCGNWL
uniref:G_PROTEIN_RECEP_F1_2 domain-containing protein n=1 Tax=Caenorhabditis tropicalis TaxID=1561998 RepID=A0A1I7V303_9PELO